MCKTISEDNYGQIARFFPFMLLNLIFFFESVYFFFQYSMIIVGKCNSTTAMIIRDSSLSLRPNYE